MDAPVFSLRDRFHHWREICSSASAGIRSHKFMSWNRQSPVFDQAVGKVVRLRNRLYGAEDGFAVNQVSGFFTVTQVQQYELGGGFLARHSDADFHVRQGLFTRFELIVLLSNKGEAVREGGLFVDVGGTSYLIDDLARAGDVVIYDVKRPHGCTPVDPDRAPDPERRRGRWIMIVPPYSIAKHLAA